LQPKAASIEILIPPYSILEALAAAAVRTGGGPPRSPSPLPCSATKKISSEKSGRSKHGVVGRFGPLIAGRTFARVRHLIFDLLAANPEMGTYHRNREVFECVVARTPFVIFYRYDGKSDITVVAIFNQSQGRDWFED
jgi:plasmid stabilization system protein ParE